MTIILNGASERLETESPTVRGVLKAKGWSFPLIIVTLNGRSVAREAWDSTPVADGDRLEASHLMSGG